MKTSVIFMLSVLTALATFGQTAGKRILRRFLFVYEARGGGWEYKKVDSILTAQGDKVYHPNMTGLGERVHLSNPDINLTTHIADSINVFWFEDLHDVILVGLLICSHISDDSRTIVTTCSIGHHEHSVTALPGHFW